jgi:hypothetical protein
MEDKMTLNIQQIYELAVFAGLQVVTSKDIDPETEIVIDEDLNVHFEKYPDEGSINLF